jgi:hypothetical protein
MADTTFEDLTEDSTADDIDAVVEQLAEEAEADREGEEKSDAQITAEQAENTEHTAEDDPPLAGSKGEKSGKNKDSQSEDWRSEALAEASAYGFSEEDIADFETREELDRALKLFERQLQTERDKLEGDEPKEPAKGETPPPKEEGYEIRLDKDIYDEEIVDEFTRLRDHYETRIAALEAHFQQEAAFAAEKEFDRSVDDLGFAELFGKTGEETDKEKARRDDLYRQVRVEQQVLAKLGRQSDYDALVRRVARGLFADEFDKKLLKNHTRKISRQSNGRQGGGATRPTDPPEDPREAADRLYKEMAQA